MFNKATKKQLKLRLLLEGTSGSGKTYGALLIASGMGKKIAVIDTEKGSAALYSDKFDFDVCDLSPPYSPERYIEAIQAADKAGYDVIVIDSISNEWSGDGGCIDIQSQMGGRFQDWAKVKPKHKKFIDALLSTSAHIISTARTKTDYSMDREGGKSKVTKVGMKTEQGDGLEYEFTSVLRLNTNHMYEASKDRTGIFLNKEAIIDGSTAKSLLKWLNDGDKDTGPKEHEKLLEGAKTLAKLKEVWLSLPALARSNIKMEVFKNEMKIKLEKSE